jgi:hypothetical protein
MTNYKIGDKVVVSATAVPRYDAHHQREWIAHELNREVEGWYVGYTFKYEGVLTSADYDPTSGIGELRYLRITNSIRLLRIKFKENGNDKFAFPEHVRKGEITDRKHVPEDGTNAFFEGFGLGDNPFEEWSGRFEEWDRDFLEAAKNYKEEGRSRQL